MIQFTSIVQFQPGQWRFDWVDTAATYYRVVLNGQVIEESVLNNYYLSTVPGFSQLPPPLEVVEETELALTEQYPLSITFQWYATSSGAYDYVIQQKVLGVWTTKNVLLATGRWVYTVTTPFLEDQSTAEWRVLARNSIGDLSDPLAFKRHIVRPPNQPTSADIVVGYDEGSGDLVIDAP